MNRIDFLPRTPRRPVDPLYLSSVVPQLVPLNSCPSHCGQLDLLSRHGVPQLAPEREGGQLPVYPDVGQQEDGGGQEELDTEDGDAVGQPSVLRPPVLHAVGPLADPESLDDVRPELDDVQSGVGDDWGRAESSTNPDEKDEGPADDHAAAGPDGVEDHVVPVQGDEADGEGGGEAEEEREEHGKLAERLETGERPGAG